MATKQSIIKQIVHMLNILPVNRVRDIHDFVLWKHEEVPLQQGIEDLQSHSKTFNFLNDDEELYSRADIKEPR